MGLYREGSDFKVKPRLQSVDIANQQFKENTTITQSVDISLQGCLNETYADYEIYDTVVPVGTYTWSVNLQIPKRAKIFQFGFVCGNTTVAPNNAFYEIIRGGIIIWTSGIVPAHEWQYTDVFNGLFTSQDMELTVQCTQIGLGVDRQTVEARISWIQF